jgi:hypothetical protein
LNSPAGNAYTRRGIFVQRKRKEKQKEENEEKKEAKKRR